MSDPSTLPLFGGTVGSSKANPLTRIAILADIHGNLAALEAVLADLARRKVDHIVNLGDHASGPLWPRDTISFLSEQPWTHISGNCDRVVLQQATSDQGASHRYAYSQLTSVEMAWLAALPLTARVGDEILLFHGTPTDDDSYLLESVERGKARLAYHAEIVERLQGVTAGVMLCGHSHIPRLVRIGDALIMNPGSVGLQAYEYAKPEFHQMETGSPDARYAIIERGEQGWHFEFLAVPYDFEAAAQRAKSNARPDWERALRSGWMGE